MRDHSSPRDRSKTRAQPWLILLLFYTAACFDPSSSPPGATHGRGSTGPLAETGMSPESSTSSTGTAENGSTLDSVSTSLGETEADEPSVTTGEECAPGTFNVSVFEQSCFH